jgi:hypothetical protein
MMSLNGRLPLAAAALAAGLAATSAHAELSGTEIATKAFQVAGGEDSRSRLTFTFHKADGSERRLVYTMAWKHYAAGEISDKAIFFSEFPPDDRGKSYMIWMTADRSKQDDEWMYLPELRMVRKITHDQSHRRKDEDDDFAHSLLAQVNLVPRNPDLDQHTLLGQDTLEGHPDYVIDSVPKEASAAYPYGKTRRWISEDNFLTERIDYYDAAGALKLSQLIKWQKAGDAWVWKQVVGSRPGSTERTMLDVSQVKVNNRLDDDLFSSRSMRLGKDSLE